MSRPAITELERLTGTQIDERVDAYLLEPIDFTTPDGAMEAQRRAELITALRVQKLWPASERRKA